MLRRGNEPWFYEVNNLIPTFILEYRHSCFDHDHDWLWRCDCEVYISSQFWHGIIITRLLGHHEENSCIRRYRSLSDCHCVGPWRRHKLDRWKHNVSWVAAL